MDQQTLLVIMAIFVAIAGIALTIQAALLFGIYKASRSVQETVTRLTPKMESLMETSRVTLEDSRAKIFEITAKANTILDQTNKQLARVDSLMSDATERTHRQLARAEMLVDDTLGRAQQTVNLVHGGVMRPLREINGVAAGLKAAIQFLTKGMRPSPERLTADEEMFI
jgi:ABC-type transporter Mla subunit MlaD